MLGRTHMSIGAMGAVVASPILLNAHWETLRQLINGHWATMPHAVVSEVTIVAASIAGSIIPDLDQPDSVMAHKVERIGQLIVFAVLAAAVVLLHMENSIRAWFFVLVFGLLAGARHNITRLLGLGVMGAGMVYLGLHHDIPLVSGVVLAIWTVGAMLTKHRTFTHSLLGLALFAFGIITALQDIHRFHFSIAGDAIVLGYALHMATDAVAGGIPILWPWSKRQGIRLVQTGSAWDHMIGGLMALAFVGLAVL